MCGFFTIRVLNAKPSRSKQIIELNCCRIVRAEAPGKWNSFHSPYAWLFLSLPIFRLHSVYQQWNAAYYSSLSNRWLEIYCKRHISFSHSNKRSIAQSQCTIEHGLKPLFEIWIAHYWNIFRSPIFICKILNVIYKSLCYQNGVLISAFVPINKTHLNGKRCNGEKYHAFVYSFYEIPHFIPMQTKNLIKLNGIHRKNLRKSKDCSKEQCWKLPSSVFCPLFDHFSLEIHWMEEDVCVSVSFVISKSLSRYECVVCNIAYVAWIIKYVISWRLQSKTND